MGMKASNKNEGQVARGNCSASLFQMKSKLFHGVTLVKTLKINTNTALNEKRAKHCRLLLGLPTVPVPF